MTTSEEKVNVSEKIKQFQGGAKLEQQATSAKVAERPLKQVDRSKKSDSSLFKEPAEFIFVDEETGKLRCNENTVQLLSEIQQPLNAVAITGLYRTGKSYLLNKLVGEKIGFKTGRSVHACTKGIWLWCRDHPTQSGQVLVLLDVEGFGDINKINRQEDTWLFTLATVLSSTLVYNNMGILDAYDLDRLNFLEEIDSTIQVSQNEEDKTLLDLDFFFPFFVVTLRDVGLEMVNKSGQQITPDEYLEELLVQKRGKGESIEKYNKIRLLIRRYFKKRKCFSFVTPCGPNVKLENLADGEIEPDFLKSVRQFSNFIFQLTPLQLKSGRKLTGRMFANLAMHYVNAIGQNKQPSILEATKYMVRAENQAIVDAASGIYKKEMQLCISNMGNIVPTDEALVDFHERCLTKALEYFQNLIVFDDEEIFQKQTMLACKDLLARFKRTCDDHSAKVSVDVIARLNMRVEKKLKNGTYCSVSGYDEYVRDINWIAKKYASMTGLGPRSREVLQVYLDGKEQEEEQVYQMVVKAQKEKKDTRTQNLVQNQLPMQINDLSKAISRNESLCESLKQKVDRMETNISQALEEVHTEEKKKIKENYLDNLGMKIGELERQRSETMEDKETQQKIDGEIRYLRKVYEYAKNVDEMTEIATADDKESEVPKLQEEAVVGIGNRPATLGASYDETKWTAGHSRWRCTIQ